MQSRASCRRSRSTTSARSAGAPPSTSGSCAGCGWTWWSRSSPIAGWGCCTWCSGLATAAAGRRWSLTGDGGGRVEVDSVWIHLDTDQRPARIAHFDAYAEAAAGRRVSARPELLEVAADAPRAPWPLRASDLDLHGHVNNTVYWQALEHLPLNVGPDLRRPLRARLDFEQPLDLGDPLELAVLGDERRLHVGFVAAGRTRAVGSIEALVGAGGA